MLMVVQVCKVSMLVGSLYTKKYFLFTSGYKRLVHVERVKLP